ncbi:hypothetical protein ACKC6B_004298 [Enterobacter hormaechei]
MARQIETRSEFEKKVKAGEVILEPPRQPGRDAATGRYVSNKRLPGMLPPFLIGQQVNITFYNDIDVEAFKQEVRAQVTRILNDIRGERFNEAGIKYQKFIDQFDACFEMPSPEGLGKVKERGVDLYAILEHQGMALTDELHLNHKPGEEVGRRFTAITDAHINLFFYMLELNLAIHNRIDSVQGQLRTKLAQLEKRLTTLLEMYIHGDSEGNLWYGEIEASQLLYGWILLKQNKLLDAMEISDSDPKLSGSVTFAEIHADVFKILESKKYSSISTVLDAEFRDRGLSDFRAQIALKLCYYLRQIKRLHQFIDELTQGSETTEPNEATVDIRSLLIP